MESFIKAGVFGSLGVKRSQLFKTFESIMENTAAAMKNRAEGQVSLFDLFEEESSEPDDSERYPDIPEFSKADLLSMEKEMLGIYLSGHPLEGYAGASRKNFESQIHGSDCGQRGRAGGHGQILLLRASRME